MGDDLLESTVVTVGEERTDQRYVSGRAEWFASELNRPSSRMNGRSAPASTGSGQPRSPPASGKESTARETPASAVGRRTLIWREGRVTEAWRMVTLSDSRRRLPASRARKLSVSGRPPGIGAATACFVWKVR